MQTCLPCSVAERDVYLKELAPVTAGADMSEICGQASRLGIQGRGDVAGLNLKSAEWACRLETQGRWLCFSVQAEFLLLWDTSVSALKAFN